MNFFQSLFKKNLPEPEQSAPEVPQAPDPFANSRCGEKPVVIYLAPHQDDELLTLGLDACRTINSGEYDVHVVLLTDGSKSNKRFEICNGKECPLHPGIHQYELSIQQFIEARDKEFRGSCDALGYAPGSIHFFPRRVIDSLLSVEAAEAAVRSVLSQFPIGSAVRTISPFGGKKQHADHRNLGLAALKLHQEGLVGDLKLFIEPYCAEACRAEHPQLMLTGMNADDAEKAQIARAIRSYSRWEPEQGRYAIGYHSVTEVFDEFIQNPVAWYHAPDSIAESEV